MTRIRKHFVLGFASLLMFLAILSVWIASHEARPNAWVSGSWGDARFDGVDYRILIDDGTLVLWRGRHMVPLFLKPGQAGDDSGDGSGWDHFGVQYVAWFDVVVDNGVQLPGNYGSEQQLRVGFLLPLILVGIMSGGCFFRVRWLRGPKLSRRIRGLCSQCGYDLFANTSGVCPECGVPTKSPV